jgi:hypothetical protein
MESQTFRASPSAYAVLCGPWLLIATLWAYVSIQTGRVQYAPIALCLMAAALFAIWLAAFRLVLAGETFAYRSLFLGTQQAQYSDVSEVSVSQLRISRLPLRARLQLRTGGVVLINWKVFPAEAVESFHDRIARA